jgi:hypothetical protein
VLLQVEENDDERRCIMAVMMVDIGEAGNIGNLGFELR